MSRIVGSIKVGKPKGKPAVGVPASGVDGQAGTVVVGGTHPTYFVYGF